MLRRFLARLFALVVRSRLHESIVVRRYGMVNGRAIYAGAWDLRLARRRRYIATITGG